MGLFSLNKPAKHIELICNIGSSSVGVAFVEFVKGLTPSVLFSERVLFSSFRVDSSSGIQSALLKDFQEVLSRALNHAVEKNIKPAHISCFYSSPWFIAQAHVLKLKQKEPFVFSEKTLKKIIDDGRSKFLFTEGENENTLSSNNTVLIERRITSIKLNGYETHNPFGKKASSAEVSVFHGALSKEGLESVESCIKRVWRGVPLEHHTAALASFAVIRNLYDTQNSFLILHISSGVTDISLVSDGCLLEAMSFPIGKKTITNRLEEACGLDHELARSALSLYIKSKIHEEYSNKLEPIIESVRKDWFTHLEHSFGEILKKNSIPSVLYIVADEDMVSFFESFIQKSGFNSYMLSGYVFQVCPIKSDIFESHVSYVSSAYKDLFVDMEALYLNLVSPVHAVTAGDYLIE